MLLRSLYGATAVMAVSRRCCGCNGGAAAILTLAQPAVALRKFCRGTCLRRPLGTRRPPRLFEKLESYCIKMGSQITRYSVLINCENEKNCKLSRRKDLQTER